MNRNLTVAMAAALVMSGGAQAQDVNIGRSSITLKSDLMTPEALWAMGRIGAAQASPDGRRIVYQVGYYSVKENKGHQVLRIMDADGRNDRLLTTSAANESDAAWLDNNTLAFLTGGQLWTMKADGTDRRQLTRSDIDIEGFRFSPDRRRVVLIKSIPYYGTIKQNPSDLPKATGMVITDMNYRHWDHYVQSTPIRSWLTSLPGASATVSTCSKASLTKVRWHRSAASNRSTGAGTPSLSPIPVARKRARSMPSRPMPTSIYIMWKPAGRRTSASPRGMWNRQSMRRRACATRQSTIRPAT